MKMQTPKKMGALTVGAGLLALLGTGLTLAQAAPHAKISAAQANAIVLKRFPGTLTAKTTLENEEGSWQYGVMVRSGRTLREVMVDAKSGKIASVETTTPGKERVEKKADESAARKARRHKAGSHR